MPKDGIHISIHGNIVAKIADAFKSLFMGTIRDQITSQLRSTVIKELPPAINKILAQQQGVTEVYKDLDLDWSIPNSPIVTPKSLEFGIKGLFFPKNQGEVEPAEQPPVMPYHDDA